MSITERCPVPILQNEWEFNQLLNIFEAVKPKSIIEIGSFYGGTLWVWSGYSFVRRITSIDLEIPPSDERWIDMVNSKKNWKLWMENVVFLPISGNSMDWKVKYDCYHFNQPEKADWLFIDGGHEYGTVKSDYENYSKMVAPNGYIVFHDIMGLRGPRKLWKQIKKRNKHIEIYNPHNGWGIGIIQKK